MKKILHKIWVYLRPFVNIKFIISYFIPFMVVNGWAWVGFFLLPIIGANWFTIASTTWLGILWLPCTPEKLITIPCAIYIHTRLFKNDRKTGAQLNEMYAEAKEDWAKVKHALTRRKKAKNDIET